ncbi:MAG: YraN family protein [Victivallaceae bacterium]
MSLSFRQARAAHLRLGRRGENLACSLLRSKNIEILCRNYKVKSGEIDIVARDGGVIAFVEVKTRRSATLSRPARSLTEKQKKRIYRAGMHYLKEIGSPKVVYRFDLIEIILSPLRLCEARHWQEHFNSNSLFRQSFST